MSPNLFAFLAVIRRGEGTSDPDGYRRHFGGKLFDSYADHPREAITSGTYTSTAAGAYQILSRTWDEIRAAGRYGARLDDFSPDSQDEAARRLIARRGALADVLAGRLEAAIAKCNKEWASLPGSSYGQPTVTLDACRRVYEAAGGTYEEAMPLPVLGAIAAAVIPELVKEAPSLLRMFGSGSEVSERNIQAAEKVLDIAKTVAGADTAEGALRVIKSEPAKAAEFREAVHQNWGDLVTAYKDAQEADNRSADQAVDRNLKLAAATGGNWLYLVGGLAVFIVIFSEWVGYRVLFSPEFSTEIKVMVLTGMVMLGFTTILTFIFGASIAGRLRDAQQPQP